MLIFLKSLGIKNILLIVIATTLFSYFVIQKQRLSSLENNLEEASEKIIEQEEIFTETVKAYEETLIIEKNISNEKIVILQEKEKVATKHQTLAKEVIKRGEIKVNEKDDFIIVEF